MQADDNISGPPGSLSGRLCVWVATGLGFGLVTPAPGTFAGLWGLGLAAAVALLSPMGAQIGVIVMLLLGAVLICDVAARANFCTLDAKGNISDRRAGRIASEESAPLAIKLREVKIPDVQIFVEPVKEHRFVVVLRGTGANKGKLGDFVHDTDPQATGVAPLAAEAGNAESRKTAEVLNEFIRQTRALLKDQPKANCATLRGVASKPSLPSRATTMSSATEIAPPAK